MSTLILPFLSAEAKKDHFNHKVLIKKLVILWLQGKCIDVQGSDDDEWHLRNTFDFAYYGHQLSLNMIENTGGLHIAVDHSPTGVTRGIHINNTLSEKVFNFLVDEDHRCFLELDCIILKLEMEIYRNILSRLYLDLPLHNNLSESESDDDGVDLRVDIPEPVHDNLNFSSTENSSDDEDDDEE